MFAQLGGRILASEIADVRDGVMPPLPDVMSGKKHDRIFKPPLEHEGRAPMPRAIKNLVILAMSPTHAAQALGLSEDTIRAAIASGELGPLYQKGSKNRLLVADIERWVRSWATKRLKELAR